jgi:hypothetical protein
MLQSVGLIITGLAAIAGMIPALVTLAKHRDQNRQARSQADLQLVTQLQTELGRMDAIRRERDHADQQARQLGEYASRLRSLMINAGLTPPAWPRTEL